MSMTKGTMWDDLLYRYRFGGMITRLIMINIGVFLVLKIAIVIGFLVTGNQHWDDQYTRLLMMPADVRVLGRQFWAPFTHMFLHEGLLHILFNMLWLYWFGVIFKDYLGESRVLPVYILGGLSGAALMLLCYNIFPALTATGTFALGASAAVMAIVIAAAAMVPDNVIHLLFLGPVKLKWIAIAVVVIDLISIPNGNTGGHIAHLGGSLFGLVFALQLKAGNDWSKPFYAVSDFFTNFFNFSGEKRPRGNRRSNVRMAYRNEQRPGAERPTAKKSKSDLDQQEQIDEILDKISRSGYESLSSEEKAFLFKMSKE